MQYSARDAPYLDHMILDSIMVVLGVLRRSYVRLIISRLIQIVVHLDVIVYGIIISRLRL